MTRKKVLIASVLMVVGGWLALLAKPNFSPGCWQYGVAKDWPSLPNGYALGQATGIGLNSKHHLIVFHRAGRTWAEPFPKTAIKRNTIAVLDTSTGKLVTHWGAGRFIMPHGLTVDSQDNIWVTDVALQQIFKFAPDGRLLLTLGEQGVAGADQRHFNQPTDIAVLPDGSFYVADGYRNTRIVRFSPDGHFLYQWGSRGAGPGQFDTPHGIALDAAGHVYVADRGNARVQVFNPRGRFVAQWKEPTLGRPYGISISGRRVAIADGGDQPIFWPDRSAAIALDLTGRIHGRCGSHGKGPGQFNLAHDVEIDPGGTIFVAEARGERVQKLAITDRSTR